MRGSRGISLPSRRTRASAREHAQHGRELIERIATARPRGVRGAVRALRARRARAGAAPPRRPWSRGGRDPGGLRRDLALGRAGTTSPGPGAPWLYTVARNAIVDGLRRTPEPAAELEDGPVASRSRRTRPRPPGPPGASTGHSRRCPRHERAVIELAYWSGLSQSEIADRSSRSRSGRSRRARAARWRGSRTHSRRSCDRAPTSTSSSRRHRARRARRACSVSTSCSSRPARRPSCRRGSPEPPAERAAAPSLAHRRDALAVALVSRLGAAVVDRGRDARNGRLHGADDGERSRDDATGSLVVFAQDAAGNWPMELTVGGCRRLRRQDLRALADARRQARGALRSFASPPPTGRRSPAQRAVLLRRVRRLGRRPGRARTRRSSTAPPTLRASGYRRAS